MIIFLDTSSLFKLYHRENDSEAIEDIFTANKITGIFLSEIAKIEFESTVWKKVRTRQITEAQAVSLLNFFESDFSRYTFIQIDTIITEQARILIKKYGQRVLRTLDSIQLSTAVSLSDKADLFITTDKLLNDFFKQEKLP